MAEKRYNFAIIPSQAVAERAVKMSEWLRQFSTQFTLDGVKLYPHVSLYHVGFQEEDLVQVIDRATSALRTITRFGLSQGPYRAVEGSWCDVSYNIDDTIYQLHTTLIESVMDLRVVHDMASQDPKWNELTPTQQASYAKCGWTDAYARYAPHLTFTKLRAPQPDLPLTFPQEDFSFMVEKIGLFELGEFGTCTKLIHTFSLE